MEMPKGGCKGLSLGFRAAALLTQHLLLFTLLVGHLTIAPMWEIT